MNSMMILHQAEAGQHVASQLIPDANDPLSLQVLGELVRRTATVVRESTKRGLIDAVVSSLMPLVDDRTKLRERVKEAVDGLSAEGSFIAISDEKRGELLQLAPPRFVQIARIQQHGPELTVVLGAQASHQILGRIQAAGADLRMDYRGVTRVISGNATHARQLLSSDGYQEVKEADWKPERKQESARKAWDEAEGKMKEGCGHLPELEIYDPRVSSRWYRDRWRQPDGKLMGVYVGRFSLGPSAGSKRWCLVRLDGGIPTAAHLFSGAAEKPHDIAWRLLHAQHAIIGEPCVAACEQRNGETTLALSLPIPSWATRSISLGATPAGDRDGALIRFARLANQRQTIDYLKKHLWMQESTR